MKIPLYFFVLKSLSLTSINLNNNHIRFLSEDAFRPLNKLVSLKMANKLIGSVPLNLSRLLVDKHSLATLDLSWSRIVYVSTNDTFFKSLRTVRLEGASFSSKPGHAWLRPFLSANTLSLDLSSVSSDMSQNWTKEDLQMFDSLLKVNTFELRHCHLTTMDSIDFASFANLIKLDLSHNDLSSVSLDAGLLSSLEHLDLSHNQISFLNESAFLEPGGLMRPLKYFNLESNRIFLVSKYFYNFANLNIVRFSDNHLQSYPFFDFANDDKLPSTLSVNNYEFYFNKNEIKTIKKLSFWAYKMIVLNFDSNQIETIETIAFRSLKQLENLSIAFNFLSLIGTDFSYIG